MDHDVHDDISTDLNPYDAAMVDALMVGYLERWGAPPPAVAEVPFSFPLGDWAIDGYIDAITAECVVEYKTSQEDITPGSTYWRALSLDLQVSLYIHAARTLGAEVNSCLYDVLAKPSIRPLKATPVESRKYRKDGGLYANQRDTDETVDEFKVRLAAAITPENFQRATIVRFDSEIDDALRALRWTCKQIEDCALAEYWPQQPQACRHHGGVCEFLPLCTHTAQESDYTKREGYTDD